jgi:hypothetical protein
MSELRNLIARHSRGEITRTAVPRLTLGKCQEKMKLSSVIYPPLFCVIALELPPSANGSSASRAMAVHRLEDDLSEPLLRLIRLLDTPQDIFRRLNL